MISFDFSSTASWVRRSFQKKGAKAPIHMVSAFAARQRLVLGQVKVAEKSNQIVAIPAGDRYLGRYLGSLFRTAAEHFRLRT